jgi:hypothetical protein
VDLKKVIDIIVSKDGDEFQVVARAGDNDTISGDIRYRKINYDPFVDANWEKIKEFYTVKRMGGRKTRRHRKKSHRHHKKSHRR